MKTNIFHTLSLVCLLSVVPAMTWSADDMDDVLGEFDESDNSVFNDEIEETGVSDKRSWDITGSLVLNGSYNYLSHESSTETDYQGLSKLRTQLNLQYDQDIADDWQTRVAAYAFYDWMYDIQDDREFTDEVKDEYQQEAEFREVWIRGKLSKSIDLKIGRQVVNWGRSESLRVLDVLNPVDNREMGLADIENLRLPVTMVKTDFYTRHWSYSLIAIPEVRFSKNPVEGNDFYSGDENIKFKENEPDDVSDTSWATSAKGIYSGWDISFHAARLWHDRPYALPVQGEPMAEGMPPLVDTIILTHSRINFYGLGANLSTGSWLLKTELAYLNNLGYTVSTRHDLTLFGQGIIDNPDGVVNKDRVDAMFGLEYYGLANTTFSFDIVNRHIMGFEKSMKPTYAHRDETETAFRVTRDFMNERLQMTALFIAFGEDAKNGSIVRATAEYEVIDALNITFGLITYQDGDPPPFDRIDKNDRVFGEIKWNF